MNELGKREGARVFDPPGSTTPELAITSEKGEGEDSDVVWTDDDVSEEVVEGGGASETRVSRVLRRSP